MESLVTKLKGVVNDDTMPKIGELKFVIDLNKSFNNPGLQISASIPTEMKCSNTGFTSLASGNVLANPYITSNPAATTRIKPTEKKEGTGVLAFNAKYNLKTLGLVNVIESYVTLEDVVNYSPELYDLYLDSVNIKGSLMCLCDKNNIKIFGITYNTSIEPVSARSFLNEMAKHRENGDQLKLYISNGGLEGSIYDIPKAVSGTYYQNYATIYFNPSYPNGWYGKNPNGKYYNSNDEEITVAS